jgi:segregation and condensation protein B
LRVIKLMSLKAKIEAVIYASEEPVTLVQLAGLLGQEAQAELDRLDSAQQRLALEGESADAEEEPGSEEGAAVTEAGMETSAERTPEAPATETGAVDSAAREPEPTAAEPASEPEPMEESPIAERPGPGLDPDGVYPAESDGAESGVAEGDGAAGVGAGAGVDTSAGVGAGATQDSAAQAKAGKADEKARERRLREYFRSLLDELIADYATSARGLEIREVAGGYRLGTKPEYHDAVRGFVKSLKPPLKLSLQALETLAVVAYKQPVTAPEISEIRGVDSGGVLGSLMARKLVTTAGRKPVIGRPILYKTTRDFLLRFGLKDIQELPSIEEFEKMAGELADVEPVQEEIPMPEGRDEADTDETDTEQAGPEHEAPESKETLAETLEPERESVEPQADGDSEPLGAVPEAEPSDEGLYEKPVLHHEEQAIGTAADEMLIDGRISGLPPRYDEPDLTEDSPGLDAEIQGDERRGVE